MDTNASYSSLSRVTHTINMCCHWERDTRKRWCSCTNILCQGTWAQRKPKDSLWRWECGHHTRSGSSLCRQSTHPQEWYRLDCISLGISHITNDQRRRKVSFVYRWFGWCMVSMKDRQPSAQTIDRPRDKQALNNSPETSPSDSENGSCLSQRGTTRKGKKKMKGEDEKRERRRERERERERERKGEDV